MAEPGARDALRPGEVARATWVLILLRAAYAYNWFDVGPALPGIGGAFAVGPAGWGLLIGSFLAGAGALQVPAGLLGRRFGNRAVSLAGAALLAVFGVASAFAPSFVALLAFRAVAGAGAGLFFSPAITLVASLYPAGRRGLAVGGFSSAFSAGAAAGVLVTALLVPSVGWRGALLLGGVMLAVLTVAGVVAVPRAAETPRVVPTGAPLSALRYRGVYAIGAAFVGMEGASFGTGQFIVPFGETMRGWAPALAGVVGMAFVLPSVVGGPVGGPVAERRLDHRRQMFVMATLGAAAVALLPVAGLAETVAIGVTFSFAYGFVYAVMYVLPHYWPALPPDEVPLAIGLFNAMQLVGGASVAYLFGRIVAVANYSVGWLALAAIQVATLVALVALPRSARPVVGAHPPVGGAAAPAPAPAR